MNIKKYDYQSLMLNSKGNYYEFINRIMCYEIKAIISPKKYIMRLLQNFRN